MQISSNIVNGPKSNSIDFGTNVGYRLVQKPSHNFLLTFRSLRMFKIVFRDSSLYPKQLPLFCLLWLINASADRIARAYARGGLAYFLLVNLSTYCKYHGMNLHANFK